MLLILILYRSIFAKLGCTDLAIARHWSILHLRSPRLIRTDDTDTIIHVTREDVLVVRGGKSEDCRGKSTVLLAATLPNILHLIL